MDILKNRKEILRKFRKAVLGKDRKKKISGKIDPDYYSAYKRPSGLDTSFSDVFYGFYTMFPGRGSRRAQLIDDSRQREER